MIDGQGVFSRGKIVFYRIGATAMTDLVPHPFCRSGDIPGRFRAAVHRSEERIISATGCQDPAPHDIVASGGDLEGVSRKTIRSSAIWNQDIRAGRRVAVPGGFHGVVDGPVFGFEGEDRR